MKPDETELFYPSQVKKIAERVLNEEFNRVNVDEKWIEDWTDFGDDFEELSRDVADKIKRNCREELNLPRYKILVQVTIGQRKDQGAMITSRCLWDTSADNYASANFQNKYVWVSALVFGLYAD